MKKVEVEKCRARAAEYYAKAGIVMTPAELAHIEVADFGLVLHGGSGLSDDDSRTAGESYLEIRNRKVAAIREEVKKKMTLFGSAGQA